MRERISFSHVWARLCIHSYDTSDETSLVRWCPIYFNLKKPTLLYLLFFLYFGSNLRARKRQCFLAPRRSAYLFLTLLAIRDGHFQTLGVCPIVIQCLRSGNIDSTVVSTLSPSCHATQHPSQLQHQPPTRREEYPLTTTRLCTATQRKSHDQMPRTSTLIHNVPMQTQPRPSQSLEGRWGDPFHYRSYRMGESIAHSSRACPPSEVRVSRPCSQAVGLTFSILSMYRGQGQHISER